ncbi:hypothetical protein EON66_07200 [archaeon]|nr:MAG: hypothetical protein EON66_07200 [archaeon]
MFGVQVVAFFVGYAMSSFLITFYILAAGVLVAVVACVPPWPQYKRLNIEWLETADDVPTFAEPEVMEGEGAEGTGEARVQRTQQAVAPKAAAQVGKSTNARAGGAAKASKR